jgi:hypothetical protein
MWIRSSRVTSIRSTPALQASPVGWLAWVTQLFQRWVDPDYIITNAAIYWLTNTIGSSIRRYYEVRRFSERDHANIVRWKHYQRGSHFSPHDAPDLLLGDIREFFRPLR